MTTTHPAHTTRPNGKAGAPNVHRVEVKVASGDMLDVRHFQVSDRMSALFEVRLVAMSHNPDIDFESVIGQPMSFTAHGPETRTWVGVCSHLQQIAVGEHHVDAIEEGVAPHLSTYELTLVPTLWLATQRRNHRMFQQMSEIDIVLQLLGEWGITPTSRLGGSYKKRKYRVQYGESDYAFICRMLEDAGVSFYFDGGDESRLVLDDGPQNNPARTPIAYRDHPTDADLEHVTKVRIGRRVRPGKYTVRDHDYRRAPANQPLASAAYRGGVEEQLERFHYVPGAFLFENDKGESTPNADDKGKYRTDDGEAAALARRRLEAQRASAREISFSTNTVDPAPGTVLTFLDHPKSELGPDKKLLVVESSFSGDVPGVWNHACTAVSTEVPYRPPLTTPKPRTQGVESATVVGPPGEEIHVDEFGRVRVHFHWDRESRMSDASSCWIHVSQPWGGAGFGGSALPRVGQEVIVDFLGGDPDRPIITGRVYTALQATPYALPANKTQSGLKSNSTQGTGGYNEIMFEDRAGSELVRMQAEKDLHKLVKNDEQVTIGHDRTKDVGHDDQLHVGHDRSKAVDNDETVVIGHDRKKLVGNDDQLQVGHDRSKAIGNDESVVIGHDETVDIGNDRRQSVGFNESLFVGANQTEQIGANRSVQVGANHSESIGENMSLNVGMAKSETVGLASAETVGAAKALSVGAAYAITVGGMMTTNVALMQSENVGLTKTVTVGEMITITCGASVVTMDAMGQISISGKDITVTATGTVNVNAQGDVNIESASNVNVKAPNIHMN